MKAAASARSESADSVSCESSAVVTSVASVLGVSLSFLTVDNEELFVRGRTVSYSTSASEEETTDAEGEVAAEEETADAEGDEAAEEETADAEGEDAAEEATEDDGSDESGPDGDDEEQ